MKEIDHLFKFEGILMWRVKVNGYVLELMIKV